MKRSYTNAGTRRWMCTLPSRNRTFIWRVAGSYPISANMRETTGVMVIVNGDTLRLEAGGVGTTDSKRGVNPHPFAPKKEGA